MKRTARFMLSIACGAALLWPPFLLPASPPSPPRPRSQPGCSGRTWCSTPRASRPSQGWVVLVTGDTIAAVGPAASVTAPAGARVDRPARHDAPAGPDRRPHARLPPPLQRDAVERPGAEGVGGVPDDRGGAALRADADGRASRRCATSAPRAPATPTSRCSGRSTRGSSPARGCSSRRARLSPPAATGRGRPASRRTSRPPKGAQEASGVPEVAEGRARAGRARRRLGEGLRRLPAGRRAVDARRSPRTS